MRTALITLLLLVLVVPSAAHAGALSGSAGALTFTAAPGEFNQVNVNTLDDEPFGLIFTDEAGRVAFAPGLPCETDDYGSTQCHLTAPTSLTIRLGSGTDTLTVRAPDGTATRVEGGDGNDMITMGITRGRNTILGGSGADTINVDTGNAGHILNPPAKDKVRGGKGKDTIDWEEDYNGHIAAIRVTLDDKANDGSSGEGDDIGSDVEVLEGTRYADRFTGSKADNVFTGGAGNDVLKGGGGKDRLLGGIDNDTLSGGKGRDFLEGGQDDDTLVGGSGFDSFVGDFSGSGNQVITGNDRIDARDKKAKEPISCGPGSDRVKMDRKDRVTKDPQNRCKTVKRSKR